MLALIIATCITANDLDHAGADTPVSKAFFACWGWAGPISAWFIRTVGESGTSMVFAHVIGYGVPVLLYTIMYFGIFSTLHIFPRARSEHHKNI